MSIYISHSLVLSDYFNNGGRQTCENFSIIAYQTWAKDGTWTASSEAADFPALSAKYPTTTQFWKPSSSPSWLKVDLGAARDIDYVGIVGKTAGLTVTVEYSNDDAAWTPVDSVIPADNTAQIYLFEEVSARYWRVSVSGGIPAIATVYVGKAMVMQRGLYDGHSPINLSRQVGYTTNITETGQFAGRSVVKKGLATSASWQHLTGNWYREYFDKFVQEAISRPFFWVWNPTEFPQEVAFCWTNNDISPANASRRDWMDVSFDLEGHSYD